MAIIFFKGVLSYRFENHFTPHSLHKRQDLYPIKKVLNLHVIETDATNVGLINNRHETQSHPGEAIGGG